MRRNGIGATGLLTASLLLVGCGEVGRYQMVVTPPYEGSAHYWNTQCHVLDTKTGVVFIRYGTEATMIGWDPANRTLRYDSLTVTDNAK